MTSAQDVIRDHVKWRVKLIRIERESQRRLEEESRLLDLKLFWKYGAWNSKRASNLLQYLEHTGQVPPDPSVEPLRQFSLEREGELKLEVVEVDTEAGFLSGSAFPLARRIEVPPARTPEACLARRHEAEHTARPCQPTHQRVKCSDGCTACVQCELAAWRFVLESVPFWNGRCHVFFRSCLRSYRAYGTAAERFQIDKWTSDGGARAIQQGVLARALDREGIKGPRALRLEQERLTRAWKVREIQRLCGEVTR